MVKNIIRHTLRIINRQRTYVLINILGLSIGIASSLLIFLFVQYNLTFDHFHENKDRICRVLLHGKLGGQEVLVTSTAAPVGPTMQKDFPEVELISRLNTWSETVLKYNERGYDEPALVEVDSTFFKIFTIPLLKGDPNNILNEPFQIVLSESTAKRIIGEKDPMGEMIHVGSYETPFQVVGIFKDLPDNTHFECNVFTSFITNSRAHNDNWLNNSFSTYALLKDGADPKIVDDKFPEMIKTYVGPTLQEYLGVTIDEFFAQGNKYRFFLQPLGEIHLNPNVEQEMKPATDPKILYIFSGIALLIIIIATINYMNLSTARSSKRAKEVGIKKVSGSSRAQLVKQFLSESVILSIISLIIAILLIEISLPYFNNLLQAKFELNYFTDWYIIPLLIGIMLFVGILAGSYPAFFLSSFQPLKVLGSSIKSSMKNGKLRSILVIIQFSISIILIIGTTIMFKQINYMINKDLGFEKEQLLIIQRTGVIGSQRDAFKNDLEGIPGVIGVTASTSVPFHSNNNNGYRVEGRDDESFLLETNWVDYDFLTTYDIDLHSGRFFSKEFATDQQGCIINEAAVKEFGFEDPFSERFISFDDNDSLIYLPVIGVVKNFHASRLQNKIHPYMMQLKNENRNWGYFSIRIASENIQQSVKEIDKTWNNYIPTDPMQYFFMDQDFENLYNEEKQNAKLAILFTVLAIMIGSLGLYGLTAFTAEQRTKEIGIRKAMGASVGNIFYIISKEIIILISISAVIGCPATYFAIKNWLQAFHYRITLGPVEFLLGVFIALLIALITISSQTLKSARLNPADSLRYE